MCFGSCVSPQGSVTEQPGTWVLWEASVNVTLKEE